MKINDFYKYSWFSDLSYVKWNDAVGIASDPADTEARFLILAANAAETQRIPGERDGTGDTTANTLGERIFYTVEDNGLGWQLQHFTPNDETGFAASLYGDGNEKAVKQSGETGMKQGTDHVL